MSYETAVSRMYALGHELAHTPTTKFDLAHMRVLLAALEHPEKRIRGVLIAGTNGKGSTAATLASILEASGWRTGLYTSPHLLKINERIRINGQVIGDNEFAWLHDLVEHTCEGLVGEQLLPWHPSFFEMLTAIAFEYFAREKVDIAVLEVGMGGRLDATNVMEPDLSVITDISLDHQKFLGATVAEIAREKAGIIRPSGAVVTLAQSQEANDVIGNAILDQGARAISAAPYVPSVSPGAPVYLEVGRGQTGSSAEEPAPRSPARRAVRLVSRYSLDVLGKQILVETPLVGRHQLRNIALAIAAAEELNHRGFSLTPESIERGIRETHWPGRFQVIASTEDLPEIVLDVAHNPAGAWALRSTLSACYQERPLTILFGAMRDKAIGEIAEILFPLAERVIATVADNPRSASTGEIRQAAHRTSTEILESPDVASALQRTQNLVGPSGLVVITGSIYIVGEAMGQLGLPIE